MVYGLAIEPGSGRLFFGGVDNTSSPYGSAANGSPGVYSIDLMTGGGFSGTTNNSNLPSGASYDNYEGTEVLHSNIPITGGDTPSFVVKGNFVYMVSDLTFNASGQLVVGVRVSCNSDFFSSYNHYAETNIITKNTATDIYDTNINQLDISTFGYYADEDSYGGVATYTNGLGNDIIAVTSSDIIRESGPHGVAVFNDPPNSGEIDPMAVISYGSPVSDPKGLGGDIEIFNGPPLACTISLNATPTACDPADNLYDLAVVVTYTTGPGGDITITSDNGLSQTFTSTGTSPETFTFTDITSDGTTGIDVTAVFVADAACTMTSADAYNAPVNCTPVACCQGQNLVQNPSFENGAFAANSSVVDPNNAMTSPSFGGLPIDNYIGDGDIFWIDDATRATDGNKFVYLPEANEGGKCVYQSEPLFGGNITTCATYQVTFDVAGFDENGTDTETNYVLEVFYWNADRDLQQETAQDEFTIECSSTTAPNPISTSSWNSLNWTRVTGTIDLPAPNSTDYVNIELAISTSSGGGLLIDNICMEKISDNVSFEATGTDPTCNGTTDENNGTIMITTGTIGQKYEYNTTGFDDLPLTFAAATGTISALPQVVTNSIANTDPTATYYLRVYESGDCFRDTSIVINQNICGTAAVCCESADNLFINPSFETGSFASNVSVVDANNGMTSPSFGGLPVDNYTIDGGVIWIEDATRATDGNRFIYLPEANEGGKCVYQQEALYGGNLTACATYEITFDIAGFDENGTEATTNYVLESFYWDANRDGPPQEVIQDQFFLECTTTAAPYPMPASDWNNLNWTRVTGTLTLPPPTSTNFTNIEFAISANDGGGALIDNICVKKVSQSVSFTAAGTDPTCTGTTDNNNGEIQITAGTIGEKYEYNTTGFDDLPLTFAAATGTISALPQVVTNSIANTDPTATYYLRVYESGDCFSDTSIVINQNICSTPTCSIGITSATPTVCDPADNLYDLAVVVTYANDPSGDISITAHGSTQTFASNSTSPQTFTLTNLTSDATADIDVTAFFVDENTCTVTSTDAYSAPANCTPNCSIGITSATPTVCDPADNLYDLAVIVTYANDPSGDISITAHGSTQTFASNGTSPQTFTLTNLTSDATADIDVTAFFVDENTCTVTSTDAYTAPANCTPNCSIGITSATPTACDPADNLYDLAVILTYANDPSGDISITAHGSTQTFASNGTSPQTFTLTNLTSDATADIDVTAFFVDENTCTVTSTDAYSAPANCTPAACSITVTSATPTACDPADNLYDLAVVVTYANGPGGNITLTSDNGLSQTFTSTGTSPETFTFTDITSDGTAGIDVTAVFVADAACTMTSTDAYNAPADCGVTCPDNNCFSTTVVKD